ncbi:hypothetical protein [Rhodoligotrophos ferricapiens]|uniref:hypothetical protein n=1 Tax=Rhodoligotrophos ferricapiens TaxID=3069264 RepID=UPI00315C5D49
MDLTKALFEQGNILAGACIALIVVLLWHIKQRNDQDRQDRTQMVRTIEVNTAALQDTRETLESFLSSTERQIRSQEEIAKAVVAMSHSHQSLKDTLFLLVGKPVPPSGDRS